MFKIYGSPSCTYCGSAKNLLESKGYSFEYVDVSKDVDGLMMLRENNLMTVPQIWFNDEHIGGFSDLQNYFNNQ